VARGDCREAGKHGVIACYLHRVTLFASLSAFGSFTPGAPGHPHVSLKWGGGGVDRKSATFERTPRAQSIGIVGADPESS
jgi:hypothetical protein